MIEPIFEVIGPLDTEENINLRFSSLRPILKSVFGKFGVYLSLPWQNWGLFKI